MSVAGDFFVTILSRLIILLNGMFVNGEWKESGRDSVYGIVLIEHITKDAQVRRMPSDPSQDGTRHPGCNTQPLFALGDSEPRTCR
jgi:hypothetical protein